MWQLSVTLASLDFIEYSILTHYARSEMFSLLQLTDELELEI